MTDNEKLIDAAEAMTADEIHQHPMAALDKIRALARELRAAEKAHTPTDDEREALADRLARRLVDDPEQLMLAEGTGALHVALSGSIRSTIEDVYADCGDSDPGVLSSNIARRLAWDLPPAILADAGFRRSEVPEPSAEHECEFGCASDAEHMQRAYDALKSEYEGYRQWVRIAFSHDIAEADAKKIASRYVWHMTPSGGGLRNSAKAMQAALSEYIKLRVEAAHAAQGSEGA